LYNILWYIVQIHGLPGGINRFRKKLCRFRDITLKSQNKLTSQGHRCKIATLPDRQTNGRTDGIAVALAYSVYCITLF